MKINFLKHLTVFSLLILFVACENNQISNSSEKAGEEIVKAKSTQISDIDKDSAEPSIAAAPDGSMYVTWVEHARGKHADVYIQHFDADANALGASVRVNPLAGQAIAWFGDAPTIKIGKDNTIYIGWTSRVESEKNSSNNLLLSVSIDGGKSFAPPVKINDDFAPASHGMHSLAIDENNHVYAAWLDERSLVGKDAQTTSISDQNEFANAGFQIVKIHHNSNESKKSAHTKIDDEEKAEPNSEIFYAVSKDGGKTFSRNVKLSGEVCPCCKTSIITAPNNKVYVSWRQVLSGDFRHIAVASSNNNGESFSKPVIVSDDQWQINACPVSGAPLAMDDKNTLKIIWFTAGKAGSPGLYEAESKDEGKTFSARFPVYPDLISGTPNLLANEAENFKTVWESNGKLYESTKQANQISGKFLMEGSLPSAVFVGGKLFVAYIKKKDGNRTINLAEI
jgi:hypothetical protein